MDFTLDIYKKLLSTLLQNGYEFQTFYDFIKNPKSKVVVLRHDVDLLPENSYRFAQIQHEIGISGTYYFRTVPESWDENIILKMDEMGHEIGYHYETMDTSAKKLKLSNPDFKWNDLIEEAYSEFEINLEALRRLVSVKTICMHGSPRSPYDNKEIWKKYNYKELGIIGEPYFDVDFNQVFYLTDTGRRWDGYKVSVRDKVNSQYTLSYHSTHEIIQGLKHKELPNQIMFTFHPQRWNEVNFLWVKELIGQNVKNFIKKFFFVN